MIVEGRKLVCDFCKTETAWVEKPNHNDVVYLENDWITLAMSTDFMDGGQQHFCSSQCVKDKLDNKKPPKKSTV